MWFRVSVWTGIFLKTLLVWMQIYLKTDKNICVFENIRHRVDGEAKLHVCVGKKPPGGNVIMQAKALDLQGKAKFSSSPL